MEIYQNRADSNYISTLRDRLRLDFQNLSGRGLLGRAIALKQPTKISGSTFNKCCQIDFLGLTSTTMLDFGGNFVSPNSDGTKGATSEIEEIFKNGKAITDLGYLVKFRFLFAYPYSSYAFTVIQAQTSVDRASIEDPAFQRGLREVETLDEKKFLGSDLWTNLTSSLGQLQRLMEKYNWTSNGAHSCHIRFTPLAPAVCALIVNDAVFYDPYLLSKTASQSRRLALSMPIMQASSRSCSGPYRNIEDHFRYLWDLDTTLDFMDATKYRKGDAGSLADFFTPHQVTYGSKAERIARKTNDSNADQRAWMARMSAKLQDLCCEVKDTDFRRERLFISCSWKQDADGEWNPNQHALQIQAWLNESFSNPATCQALDVILVNARVGTSLTSEIYGSMRSTSLAIILMTPDIKTADGSYLSKPNIYHELGYLQNQLQFGHVSVLKHSDITMPTNLADNVYISFATDKVELVFYRILKWLSRHSKLTTFEDVIAAIETHKSRLDQLMWTEHLSVKEVRAASTKLELLDRTLRGQI